MSTPTEATYQYSYILGTSFPTESSTYPIAMGFESTLTDNLDGNSNGIVVTGADMTWSGAFDGPGPVQLAGLTKDGSPIIFDANAGPGLYSLLSNDGDLVGQPIKLDTLPATYTMCFAAGTLIQTDAGQRPVETLRAGMRVQTLGAGCVPIRWVGVQTLSAIFGYGRRYHLVRILPGALGNGLPRRDLVVTSDHALLLDGMLCHAGALVNGVNVLRVPGSDLPSRFQVFHIETDAHQILFAEGAMAESFLDTASRGYFDNGDEGAEAREMAELDYPRAMSQRQVPPCISQGVLWAGLGAGRITGQTGH
ncbi:MAG: Hint domain-containing protein [Marinibacterium sp.]|nr:Hint domain-containing protein [Marinibacterium sp.]